MFFEKNVNSLRGICGTCYKKYEIIGHSKEKSRKNWNLILITISKNFISDGNLLSFITCMQVAAG